MSPNQTLKDISEAQTPQRSQKLRENGGWIPEPGYRQRKFYFADKVHLPFGVAAKSNQYLCGRIHTNCCGERSRMLVDNVCGV